MNDEGRVLDGKDRQEGGPAGVMGWDERYWTRFLKGMVTDRNTRSIGKPSLSAPLLRPSPFIKLVAKTAVFPVWQ
jgi:hypothetical protein